MANILKKIKNVVEDVAPVVLPAILATTGLGPIAGAAIGSGISTLMRGGKPEDAFKSALVGGGIGALYAGASGVNQGRGFMEGVKGGLPKGILSTPTAAATEVPQMSQARQDFNEAFAKSGAPDYTREAVARGANIDNVRQVQELTQLQEPSFLKGPSFLGYQGAPSTQDILGSQQFADRAALLQKSGLYDTTTAAGRAAANQAALKQITEEYTPSFLQQYALPIAGATGIMAALSPEVEEEELEEYETGFDLYEADPDKYSIFNQGVTRAAQPTMSNVVVPYSRYITRKEDGGIVSVPDKYKGFSKLPEGVQQKIDPELANKYARGGDVEYFPRRNGGIGPGEGSGTKDDVPALLMDGEFVMTRNAVKAAGGGNIKKGIDNMYGLMRNLEARA